MSAALNSLSNIDHGTFRTIWFPVPACVHTHSASSTGIELCRQLGQFATGVLHRAYALHKGCKC